MLESPADRMLASRESFAAPSPWTGCPGYKLAGCLNRAAPGRILSGGTRGIASERVTESSVFFTRLGSPKGAFAHSLV